MPLEDILCHRASFIGRGKPDASDRTRQTQAKCQTNRFTEWRPGGAASQMESRWRASIGELSVSCGSDMKTLSRILPFAGSAGVSLVVSFVIIMLAWNIQIEHRAYKCTDDVGFGFFWENMNTHD